MHAEDPTHLSLQEFAAVMGIHPLHFAGVLIETEHMSVCSTPWVQYDWQNGDRTSREAVGRAISDAERTIEQYLSARLMPSFEVGEPVNVPQPWRPEFVNYNGLRLRGFAQQVKAKWGWFVAPGKRAVTALAIIPQVVDQSPPADIVWSSGGYWEVGTILVDLTGAGITDAQEIRIFYPDHDFDATWEIRPTEVTIAGTVATVVFKRENAVDEDIWNRLEIEEADGTDDNDFLTTVDVARVYVDPSESASLIWEPLPWCPTCQSTNGSCPSCSALTQAGCLLVNDPKLSEISFMPATWNTETQQFDGGDLRQFRQPERLEINYFAGMENKGGPQPLRRLSPRWRDAVAYFAAALLERPPCDCAPDSWEYWREDLSTSNPGEVAIGGRITNVSKEDLMNPFGTRRGAIYAWKRVLDGEALPQVVLSR